MSTISVLYIANDSSLYGANKSLVNMLQSFNQEGIKSQIKYHVIIPLNGPIQETFEELNIPYSIVRYRFDSALIDGTFYTYISFIPKLIQKYWLEHKALPVLRKIVDEKKIQIVHTNSSVISIGLKLSKICRTKHIWHLREFQDTGLNLQPYWGWSHLIRQINESDAVISITKPIETHYKVKANSIVLFDAVSNTAEIVPASAKEKYFIFCGSISHNKGVHVAVRSFYHFWLSHPDYQLLIAGTESTDRPYVASIHQMVEKYKLKDHVQFLGYRKDINNLMNKAQALLMCSRNEGMGRVTPEAMLNNCLVIGFNDAGTKELIVNGETGFLFNTEEELVQLMNDVADSKTNSGQITKNAFGFAKKHFLEETYGFKLLDIYASILKRKTT